VTNWPISRARDLPPAALRTHQQEAGYVHRGNQQQQAGSAEQDEEDRAYIADNDVVQRCHGRALIPIGIRVLFLQL
jgi:hypothetical protein